MIVLVVGFNLNLNLTFQLPLALPVPLAVTIMTGSHHDSDGETRTPSFPSAAWQCRLPAGPVQVAPTRSPTRDSESESQAASAAQASEAPSLPLAVAASASEPTNLNSAESIVTSLATRLALPVPLQPHCQCHWTWHPP